MKASTGWALGSLIIVALILVVSFGSGRNSNLQQHTTDVPSLMGFGATLDDWNRNHVADTRFMANSAYDPDPTLPDKSHDDRYLVTLGAGRVLSYEMRLSGSPNIEEAKTDVLKEFPSDAAVVWFDKKSQCSQMEVASKILGGTLSGSDSQNGQVLVEFQTITADGKDAYDSASNNDLFFNLGAYQTAQDAPGC